MLITSTFSHSMFNFIKMAYIHYTQQLIYASGNKDINKVKELIDLGVDINQIDHMGYTALLYATNDGEKEIVELLIKSGANVNIISNFGSTALIAATSFNDDRIVKLLINAGANLNHKSIAFTPLIIAARKNCQMAAKLLIEAGADLNVKDHEGNTALIFASQFARKEIANLLINAGADINIQNNFGETALILAEKPYDNDENEKFYKKEIIKLLINHTNSWKREIYKAIDKNNYDNFKRYILKLGTVCFKDKDGNNLLHYTFKKNNIEFAKLIFSLNPKLISQKNNENKTPIEVNPAFDNYSFIKAILGIKENQNYQFNLDNIKRGIEDLSLESNKKIKLS